MMRMEEILYYPLLDMEVGKKFLVEAFWYLIVPEIKSANMFLVLGKTVSKNCLGIL
jgi:hypothetical protein